MPPPRSVEGPESRRPSEGQAADGLLDWPRRLVTIRTIVSSSTPSRKPSPLGTRRSLRANLRRHAGRGLVALITQPVDRSVVLRAPEDGREGAPGEQVVQELEGDRYLGPPLQRRLRAAQRDQG